ncbi:MAG: hypothetical protein H6738_07290 [Alphaproteobacteria bacterium]|nr:hypothetical protein [Alphaproteobacteria bacterium]MCB9696567.1 hypothetical protein [Alphaproteobacteria bacterium]
MRTVGLLVFLAGCGTSVPEDVPEDEFAMYAAAVTCERIAECSRAAYEVAYYGMGDCRATEERHWEGVVDVLKDCDYSASRAGDRLREVQEMDCEDWYEGDGGDALAEVWDSPC